VSRRNGLLCSKGQGIIFSERSVVLPIRETIGAVSCLVIDEQLPTFTTPTVMIQDDMLIVREFGARNAET
jgi:hypothetical protein